MPELDYDFDLDFGVETAVAPEPKRSLLHRTPKGITQGVTKYYGEVGKGLLRGAEGMATGASNVVEWLGEELVNDSGKIISKFGRRPKFAWESNVQRVIGEKLKDWGSTSREYWTKQMQSGIEAPDPEMFRGKFLENPSFTRAMADISGAIPSLGAAMMVTYATQNPMLGASFLGTVEGSQSFIEARQAGKSVDEASRWGTASVIGTSILEVAPISRFFKGGSKHLVKDMFMGAIQEGGEEALQALWQNMIAKIGYEPTRDLTIGMVEGFIAGAGSGGMMGGFTSGGGANTDRIMLYAIDQGVTPQQLNLMGNAIKNQIVSNSSKIERFLSQGAEYTRQRLASEAGMIRLGGEEDAPILRNTKDIVEKAGGKWIGVQSRQEIGKEDLIMFNEPTTGSTLAIPRSEFSEQAVQAKMQDTVRKFVGDEFKQGLIIEAKKYKTAEEFVKTKKELKNLNAEIIGDKVKLYRGGDVSKSELKNLRYNDYLSLVKEGTDASGNEGASGYGKNVIEIEVSIKDIKITNGEIQYIGKAKSLKGGIKYPPEIYKAYNDVYGSNYTAQEIDKQENVRSVASQGLSGGREEFDQLTAIYKQAKGAGVEADLIEQAKKFDTAEEFVGSNLTEAELINNPSGLTQDQSLNLPMSQTKKLEASGKEKLKYITSAEKAKIFFRSTSAEGFNEREDAGIFFANDIGIAKQYSGSLFKTEASKIQVVKLDIKNPYYTTKDDIEYHAGRRESWVKELKEEGYDSIVEIPSENESDMGYDVIPTEIAVFDKSQVKEISIVDNPKGRAISDKELLGNVAQQLTDIWNKAQEGKAKPTLEQEALKYKSAIKSSPKERWWDENKSEDIEEFLFKKGKESFDKQIKYSIPITRKEADILNDSGLVISVPLEETSPNGQSVPIKSPVFSFNIRGTENTGLEGWFVKRGVPIIDKAKLDAVTMYNKILSEKRTTTEKDKLTDIWNKAHAPQAGGLAPESRRNIVDKLRKKGIEVENIGDRMRLDSDVTVQDKLTGSKVTLKKGHELVEVNLSNGQVWLHDGKDVIINKSQLSNVEGHSTELGEKEQGIPGSQEVWKGQRNPEVEKQITKLRVETSIVDEQDKERIYQEIKRLEKVPTTKFHQYQTPGGENYRELVVTAPSVGKKPSYQALEETFKQQGVYTETVAKGEVYPLDREGRRMSRVPYKSKEELLDKLWAQDQKDKGRLFKSAHWDEDNPLYHIRMNDRVVDGKKVLFIEEIQSDWAKAVRGVEDKAKISHPALKNWHEHAVNKALEVAVREGYDAIAWTTGEQQADRYDLSKQVDEVMSTYMPRSKTYAIQVYKKSGEFVTLGNFSKERLSSVVGKELSKKIINNEGGELEKLTGRRRYKTPDLKVGGEWAKHLYDKMIPQDIKKLTGQPTSTTPLKIPGEEGRLKWTVLDPQGEPYDSFPGRAEAEQAAKDVGEGYTVEREADRRMVTHKQPYFKITPAVKRAILGEQPQAGGLTPEQRGKGIAKTLTGEILQRGGIDPDSVGKDYNLTELREFGLGHILKKGGQSLDDLAGQFQSEGLIKVPLNKNPGDYLMELLQGKKTRKLLGAKSDKQYDIQYKEFLKREGVTPGEVDEALEFDPDKFEKQVSKERLAQINKIRRFFDKPSVTPKSEVKPLIRRTTGQYLREAPTIKESQALKRLMERQSQVARKAGVETKRKTKETLQLIRRIKKAPIENMAFEQREQLEKLKDEVKRVRTLDELRRIYNQVEVIKQYGKNRYAHTKAEQEKMLQIAKDALRQTLNLTEVVSGPQGLISTRRGKRKEMLSMAKLAPRRPSRVFDMLDGGQQFEGPHNQFFYNRANRAEDEKIRELRQRKTLMADGMTRIGITENEIMASRVVDGVKYTVDEMLTIYTGAKNLEKTLALMYGNGFTVSTMRNVIEQMTQKEKAFGDFIVEEYEKNYPRLRRSFIEYTDGKHDLGKVKGGYTPIRRTMNGYIPTEEELLQEFMARNNLRDTYVQRGFTKERVKIPKEYQQPIRLGEFSSWIEMAQKQEHFIAYGSLVKELHKMANDRDFIRTVRAKYGDATLTSVNDWVNRVANPTIYKAFTMMEKAVATLRQNAAIAYLGINLVTMMKQAPSLALFLSDVSANQLLAGIWEYSTNFKSLNQKIHALAPQMQERSLERELEEFKIREPGLYNRMLKKYGEKAMFGIYAIDTAVTHAGWLAVFNKYTRQGLSEVEAADRATRSVLRTQPAAHAKDIAGLYAQGEFVNIFLQFSNQLNQVYNILTYDIPANVRTGHYADAIRSATGVVLTAYLISWIVLGHPPFTKEDLVESGIDQFLSYIPLFGKGLASLRKGFDFASIPAFSGIEAGGKSLFALAKGNRERALREGVKSAAILSGALYAQPKRLISAFKNRDAAQLLRSKKQEKSTDSDLDFDLDFDMSLDGMDLDF